MLIDLSKEEAEIIKLCLIQYSWRAQAELETLKAFSFKLGLYDHFSGTRKTKKPRKELMERLKIEHEETWELGLKIARIKFPKMPKKNSPTS